MNRSQRLRVHLDMLARSHLLAIIFITLAILLNLLIAAYWQFSLEPRLTAQTNTLAQAQAGILARFLSNKTPSDSQELEQAMDTILQLQDPATQKPIVQRIEASIRLVTATEEFDTLELARGLSNCENCLVSEVALSNEQTGKPVGSARIHVNRNFLTALKDDFREKLWWSGVIVTLIVLSAWLLIENFLRKSKTTRRAGGMMKAPGGGYVRVQPISSAPGVSLHAPGS
ncbi:MAG: hypothetical protein N0E45_14860 [Candidatus Thiodiazotropha endolucinida]|nr:hypothetical protein [Candidatus Thiodiazotropha taylori]MCW4300916.1 hypothetical protein [Candidatus Thiodiazotropha endolucinida]